MVQKAGARSGNRLLTLSTQSGGREGVGRGRGNKVSRPDPSEHVFKGIQHPEKFHSLPNSTTSWRPSVLTPEPMGMLQIDPTKGGEKQGKRVVGGLTKSKDI